jgi:ubiquinone biosynthesis protein Coq4
MKEEIEAILNRYTQEHDFIHNLTDSQFEVIKEMLSEAVSAAWLEAQ